MQPTSSIGGTGEQTRTFKQSIAPKILSTLVIVFFIGLAALLFIPKWLPNTMTQGMRVTIAMAVVGLIAIIAIVLLILGLNRVVVSPTTAEVRNPLRVIHTFPRQSTYFTTHVLKRTTNGIPSGSERSLVAHTNGETTKIALGTMSRKTFNELFAMLDSTQQQAAAAQADSEVRRFAKPDGTTIADRVPQGFAPRTFTANRASGGGAKMIEVSSQGVAIDGQVYPYAGMSRLWITPATYTNRKMRLIATGGTTKSISFGKGAGKPEKQRFPDWPEIVDAVQRSAAAYPGLVALDLE